MYKAVGGRPGKRGCVVGANTHRHHIEYDVNNLLRKRRMVSGFDILLPNSAASHGYNVEITLLTERELKSRGWSVIELQKEARDIVLAFKTQGYDAQLVRFQDNICGIKL